MDKLEYFENEKARNKKLINNISDSIKKIDAEIAELKKSKNKTDKLINKFQINCYNYNFVDEIIDSRNKLVTNFENVLKETKVDKIKNENEIDYYIRKINDSNDILDNYNIQLNSISKENVSKIDSLQMNAIKKGIYDKFMLIKSEIDRDRIKNKFDKVQYKSTFIKIIEFIFGEIEGYQARKESLFLAIQIIDETREDILKNNKPEKEYKIIEILADIELFLKENKDDKKYSVQIKDILELKENIENTFSIDIKKLKEEINNKQKDRLPVVISKKMNKTLRERQKMIVFLNKNGYSEINKYEYNVV